MGSLIFENTVYVNDPTWNSVNNSTVRTKTIFGKSAIGKVYLIPAIKNTHIKSHSSSEQVLDKAVRTKPRQSRRAV